MASQIMIWDWTEKKQSTTKQPRKTQKMQPVAEQYPVIACNNEHDHVHIFTKLLQKSPDSS